MNSRKLSKQKASDKAGAILARAMQEFMTYGYAAASMDRIAVAAGVSKPTLYSYFQDKEGLFTALIHQITEGEPPIELGKPPTLGDAHFMQLPLREGLKQLTTNILDEVSGERSIFTLVRLIIGESGRFPALAQTFVRNVEKPKIEQLSRLFANHPDINVPDPEVAARLFIGGILHYIIMQEILHGQEILPLDRERFTDSMVDLIMKALTV
jgi:AcrR family transcriptional regulator